MNCDIIITTYNRPLRASKTIQQFLDLPDHFFGHIIVVDSSDHLNRSDYPASAKIVYIKSSHKNQPYQRFLGYLASNADILLYLDDDMDLLDTNGFTKSMESLADNDIAGISFGFRNDNSFLASAPKNISAGWNSKTGRIAKWITGAPQIGNNKFWLCGLRGLRTGGQPIEYLQGGAFAARRNRLYQDFNYQIFDLFEERLGMGEDAILGFTLAQTGKIWAAEGETFYHDDQKDSTYTPDLLSFNRRVAFSRLYLSGEYARLKHTSSVIALLHYHWYMLWRTIAMVISLGIKPSKQRLATLQGWAAGWFRTLHYRLRPMKDAGEYWLTQAKQDLVNAKHPD